MNRRYFFAYLGLSAITVATGVGGYISYFIVRPSKLERKLKPLYDISFKNIAHNMEPNHLFATLRSKGVIDENSELNASVVKALAKTDQVIGYEGRYYSQTELELYSFAYLIHEGDMLLLE